MRFVLTVLFLVSFSALGQTPKANMLFWYEVPTYPGDGEAVSTDGDILLLKSIKNKGIFTFDFSKKSPKFVTLGGWMKDIDVISGSFPLISRNQMVNEFYFGSSEGKILVATTKGTKVYSASCQQSLINKETEPTRTVTCFLNGNDSISFLMSI